MKGDDKMIYLEDETKFKELIAKGDVLVDFYATWCGPCKMVGEVLEELEEHFEGLKIIKIDVDEFENIAKEHGVMSIPTLEVYHDGKLIKKEVGYRDYDTIASWFIK